MNQKNVPRKRGKGGRPPKDDPAFRRLTVNLTGQQHAAFLSMYEQSGLASLSAFIAARIFGDEFRVVKTDATALEFVTKLTAFYGQIRVIGTVLLVKLRGYGNLSQLNLNALTASLNSFTPFSGRKKRCRCSINWSNRLSNWPGSDA